MRQAIWCRRKKSNRRFLQTIALPVAAAGNHVWHTKVSSYHALDTYCSVTHPEYVHHTSRVPDHHDHHHRQCLSREVCIRSSTAICARVSNAISTAMALHTYIQCAQHHQTSASCAMKGLPKSAIQRNKDCNAR